MPVSLVTPQTSPKIKSETGLRICELFIDTLQGEGVYQGFPANFLRLSGCPLGCQFCDSTDLWTKSQLFSYGELMSIFDKYKRSIFNNHLIVTGGSPLLQQEELITFFYLLEEDNLLSFIEVENECIIKPLPELIYFIDCWNNSPKLSNSGIEKDRRYRPEVIKFMSSLDNSWFKFVVSSEDDLREIENDFLLPNLIKRDQVILMPMGENREELHKNRLSVAEMAMKNGFRYSDRLHIELYDRRKGV